MKKTKEELIEIFNETVNSIHVGGYKDCKGDWHELEKPSQTIIYKTVKCLKNRKDYPRFDEEIIYAQEIDSFKKAEEFKGRCCVLNMASFSNPGGGVTRGSRAQEEDLCRRSTLYEALPQDAYPIPLFGGLYTKSVTVFKNAQSYSPSSNPFSCSIVSVPALRKPELDKNGRMLEDDIKIIKGKIRAILRIAILGGHYNLVLGAFGCGAYGCNPKDVAQAFRDVLIEKEFYLAFKEVCFAIIEDKNSKGRNLQPFKEICTLKLQKIK